MSRILFSYLGILLALTACAAKNPWTNPQLPKSQWESDWANCKDRAAVRTGGTMYEFTDSRRVPTPFDEIDRQAKKSETDDAVTSCMIGLGYLPTRKSP